MYFLSLGVRRLRSGSNDNSNNYNNNQDAERIDSKSDQFQASPAASPDI